MAKLKVRRQSLERMVKEMELRLHQEAESESALRQLERFCQRVSDGLEALAFEERQELLRLVVEKVVVEGEKVRVETVIPIDGDGGELRTPHPELVEGHWQPHCNIGLLTVLS